MGDLAIADHGNGRKGKDELLSLMPLSAGITTSVGTVGGKAFNLIEMLKAGFTVPGGFIVPINVYSGFLSDNQLIEKITELYSSVDVNDENSLTAYSSTIRSLIISGSMRQSLMDEIMSAVGISGPDTLWAVRSSAAAEDMPEASFAGQQDTFLNVEQKNIIMSVKRCWASYWNERAIAYRHNAGISPAEGGIAVIIQKMVDARVSGVMFTVDPVNGSERIIIESSWGLGESIVSGVVIPDRFVFDKTSGTIEQMINIKSKGIFFSHDGSVVTDIEEKLRHIPSLEDAQVRSLVESGKSIERYFGCPQDVEWAIEDNTVHILQSRPITTIANDNTLWTRAYGDEYWADVTSPLFFSILGEYLSKYVLDEGNRIMGYKDLAGKELLKVHKSHIYFNAEVLEGVFTYNPKFSRTKELLNYFPEKDQARIANEPTKLLRRLLAEVRIMILDPDGAIPSTDKAYRKWAKQFLGDMKAFDALDLSTLSDESLHKEFNKLERSLLKHYRLIRYGMVTHSIGTNLMIKRWLDDWLDDSSGILYAKLMSGLPDNKTIETNVELEKLASAARKDQAIMELLRTMPSNELMQRLEKRPECREFLMMFERFLEKYGHRSHTREIFFPRWADDPSLVVDMLKTLATSRESNIETLEKERCEDRVNADKEISEKLSFSKRLLFNTVLKYARIYLVFRENQRFYLDHQIYRQRRLFLEYGRRFVERQMLDMQEDIFFLSKEEIFGMAESGSKDMKKTVMSGRNEFDRNRNILPPKFLKGGVEFDDVLRPEDNTLTISGTSASPGIAVGIVRVVDNIKDLSMVEEGEILVTLNTDPGWTPVFSKIGALVTETGGILCHGAVVSREYRIPAVTAVRNATHILHTGQKARVDGNTGMIYILGDDRHGH